METTILELLALKKLFVSRNSKGYCYDTESDFEFGNRLIKSNEDFLANSSKLKFDFGLLKCEKVKDRFEIIDGEQRLTLITIFSAAVFSRLKKLRYLRISDLELYEDILVRNGIYKFQTIPEDRLLLQNYIVNGTENVAIARTESAKRIIKTFDFFENYLMTKCEEQLTETIGFISEIDVNFQLHKPIKFRYSQIKNNMLLDLFEDQEIAMTLAYILEFNEHKNLKTEAHDYHIEISNDNIRIAVILYVGFQDKHYNELKNSQNLHLVSCTNVFKEMQEFKNLPIKYVDLSMIATCMVARDCFQNFERLNLLNKIC